MDERNAGNRRGAVKWNLTAPLIFHFYSCEPLSSAAISVIDFTSPAISWI